MTFEARGRHIRQPFEVRADDDGVRVVGHAAVFRQEADIAGLFRERIAPGAFGGAIGRDDVVFLVDHDGLPLARTRSGTLSLSEDETGLRVESQLDTTDPDVSRLVAKMRRGDMDSMSFAFFVEREEWDDTGETPLRTIHKAGLRDVSVVTFPAYEGTDIGLRSLEGARRKARQQNFSAARTRLRMKHKLAGRQMRAPKACALRGQNLGELLGRLRDEAEVTNAGLGDAAGISESTVGQIVSGEINCPPIERLEGFAEVLGVSVERLVSAAESDGCDYSDDDA